MWREAAESAEDAAEEAAAEEAEAAAADGAETAAGAELGCVAAVCDALRSTAPPQNGRGSEGGTVVRVRETFTGAGAALRRPFTATARSGACAVSACALRRIACTHHIARKKSQK